MRLLQATFAIRLKARTAPQYAGPAHTISLRWTTSGSSPPDLGGAGRPSSQSLERAIHWRQAVDDSTTNIISESVEISRSADSSVVDIAFVPRALDVGYVVAPSSFVAVAVVKAVDGILDAIHRLDIRSHATLSPFLTAIENRRPHSGK